MTDSPLSGFELAWNKTLDFLEALHVPYLTIGGLAVAVVGEPRATVDLDFDIKISKNDPQALEDLLAKAKKFNFEFNKTQALADAAQKGAFRLHCSGKRIDFILASTPLEEDMFRRAQKIKLLGRQANFPQPEDLILLKIVPGRTQDIADIEKILRRHKANLDTKYLLDAAQKISDAMENGRVYSALKQLVNSCCRDA